MAKVLVVDDEVAEILASTAECFGYEADQAGSIAEALEKLTQGAVDLVLLDVNLPDAKEMAGLEKIRAAYPNLKVIMVTGNVDDNLEKKAKELGVLEYLLKPFKMEKLQEVLAKVLGGQ